MPSNVVPCSVCSTPPCARERGRQHLSHLLAEVLLERVVGAGIDGKVAHVLVGHVTEEDADEHREVAHRARAEAVHGVGKAVNMPVILPAWYKSVEAVLVVRAHDLVQYAT